MSKIPIQSGILSAEKLELLELRLKQKGISTLKQQAITRRKETASCPLSFAQQRLWFLDQLEPGSAAYIISMAVRLCGALDVGVLEQSLKEVVRRHESLRTTFSTVDGQPKQIIGPVGASGMMLADLSSLYPQIREIEVRRLVQQNAQSPFDLMYGPLLRTTLLRLREDEHALLLSIHHIIADGWSMDVLVRELSTLYSAFVVGEPSPLPDLPVQYADFATWQRQWLQGEVLDNQLAYWTRQLAGSTPLDLSTDHPRPVVQTFRGARQSVSLPASLSGDLKQLSQRAGVTLFMTLLAAFQALLSHYTGQTDVVVGTPIANRTRAEIEGLIGFFVNTLVLRTDLSGNPSFLQLLGRVREVALEAYAHQDVPFEKLVEVLQPERNLSRSPLFQVMFALQQAPQSTQAPPGLTISSLSHESTTTKFDLSLSVVDSEQGLHCMVEYNTDLFEASTITRFLAHFHTLLAGIVAHPECCLADLPLLPEKEKRQLLDEWNQTTVAYPHAVCIHTLFETQAELTPDAVAVVCEGEQLTYGQLNARANQLAHYLHCLEVGPEKLVGLCLERSLDLIVGLLGILKAGGAYVPLDPTYPGERLAFMLADAQVAVVVTSQVVLASRELEDDHFTAVYVDSGWPAVVQQSSENTSSGVQPENLAYVMYTSGSTGTPKGVSVSHHAIANRLLWSQHAFPLTLGDRVLQIASVSFDIALWELLGPLICGAQVLLARPGGQQDSTYLANLIVQQQITVAHFVPSLLRVLLEEPAFHRLPHLRSVYCGGEAWSPNLAGQFFSHHHAQLTQFYGPTEAAINVTSWTAVPEEAPLLAPIGRPIANEQVYLLNAHLQPVPIGVPGEIHIGGVALARGYLRRPELSAERFIPHPFSIEPGARLYRTGDLARYRPTGDIEYLGRLDQQVKVRGYRIELGEIDAVLAQHPDLHENVVVLRENEPGDRRLVAYVVVREGTSLSASQLRNYLKRKLPDYMVPSYFIMLESLPLTPNGKVDHHALPSPDSSSSRLNVPFVAPRTTTEEKLAAIWAQLLQVDRVGILDNFFALGGDSILSIQIVARATQAGLPLTPKQLFQHQTIEELSLLVDRGPTSRRGGGGAEKGGDPWVVQAEQGPVVGPVPLTPIQHRFFEQRSPQAHDMNQAVMLELAEDLQPHILALAIHHLPLHHDALRLRFESSARGWQAYCSPPTESIPFLRVDLTRISRAEQSAAMKIEAAKVQASLNLESGRIVRFALFELGNRQPSRLLIVIHHLAVDGVSWRILLADLETICQQLRLGEAVVLPPKTTSFLSWAEALTKYAQSAAVQQECAYWLAPQRSQVEPLPLDEPGGANTEASASTVSCSLSVDETHTLLHNVPQVYRTQINDILLTALVQAFAAWTGKRMLLVDLEGHGREEIIEGADLSRTVGWFTTLFPLLMDVETPTTPTAALKAVKEQLRRLPQRGIGYGLLRYLSADSNVAQQLADLPPAQVSFNYLGQIDTLFTQMSLLRPAPESPGPIHSEQGYRRHLLQVVGMVVEEKLRFTWRYSTQVYRAATIQRIAQHFQEALQTLVAHCQSPEANAYTPSDFPLVQLNQQQLDRLIGRQRQIEDMYPLSPMQEAFLFHTLQTPGSGVYFEQLERIFEGPLDLTAFQRAWQHAVERHPVLRTSFHWQEFNKPLQIVHQRVQVPWCVLDWRALEPREQQIQLDALRQADRQRGFDLSVAPLMRLTLVRLSEQKVSFIWSHHHLLLDGWSRPLVLKEVLFFYQHDGLQYDRVLARPRPYGDYIAWLQQQDMTRAEQFWRQHLAGFTAPTSVQVDQPAYSRMMQPIHAERQLQLSTAMTDALRDQARKRQLTLNTLVQGAWALLLSRYSGKEDIVFGSTVAGRPATLAGVESMIGLFINTLPMRVRVAPQASLRTWLSQLQTQQIEVQQYEYTPLVDIQRWSEVPSGQSLFENIVVFENPPVEALALEESGDLEVHPIHAVDRSDYPFSLRVAPRGAALSLYLLYNGARFETATITRILEHFQMLLEAIALQSEWRIADLPSLSKVEREQVLVEWNETEEDAPLDLCLQTLFEAQVERSPDAVAVVYEDEQLTYAELNRRANQLAHYLQALGVGPEVLVGLCLERSLEQIIGLLAIVKAGGAYVPLEPSYPPQRLAFLLADTQVGLLLTSAALAERLPPYEGRVLCLEREWPRMQQQEQTNPSSTVCVANAAYVIYTSGSTGRPKGVVLTHQGIGNLAQAQGRMFGVHAGSHVLQFAALSFDASLSEIAMTLLRGASLYLAPQARLLPGMDLVRLLQEQAITVVTLPPSSLAALPQEEALPTVGTLIVAGEVCRAKLLARWGQGRQVFNAYGPTETTVCASMEACEAGEEQPGIGRPLANTRLYLLDPYLQPVPVGVPGEVYIEGVGLARGYLRRAELTAERFVPDAFSRSGGGRLYKTGDVARYRPDGTIDFVGRVDQQVKVRGYRIELGEIEMLLGQHPAVRESVVVVREVIPGDQQLVAYVVGQAPSVLSSSQLRGYVQEKLPDYMVPSFFVLLEALPLTPSGKVDRQILPTPGASSAERNEGSILVGVPIEGVGAPRNPIEEMVAGIFSDVLALERVGIHDNFFELGGHSLLATQLIVRVRTVTQVDLPMRDLFETPTVAELATQIEQALRSEQGVEVPPLVPISREQDLPLSFAQQRLWFLDQLEPGSSAYNIPVASRLGGTLDTAALQRSLGELVRRHESLRTIFRTKEGQPVQVIRPARGLRVLLVELSGLSPELRAVEVQQLAKEEAQQPFDLARGPLLRAALLRLSKDEHVLLLNMHHIVSDGWSMGVLVRELTVLYNAFVAGKPSPLPELLIQYADFASWQRQWLQGAVLDAQVRYWKQQLSGLTALDLPTDRLRPAVQTFHGAHQGLLLPVSLSDALKGLSQGEGVTLFMMLSAALQTLLYRYTEQNDIAVGTLIASRSQAEIEGVIGFFINTLVLRTDLSGNPTFQELLGRVREVALGAYTHQDIPFEKVVEVLQPERDLSRSPLFQVMFQLEHASDSAETLQNLTVSALPSENRAALYDITLTVTNTAQELSCGMRYNTDLFDRATIIRLLGHWQVLLEAIVADPAQRVADLSLLTGKERQQLLVEWNKTEVAYPLQWPLHQRFSEQAARTPQAIALVCGETMLTYREVDRRSNQLAHLLRSLEVGPEVLVGLYMERSVEMVVAMLAIFKAGGAYVPLDPSYPEQRLAFILAEAQIPVIVTQPCWRESVPREAALVCLEPDWQAISAYSQDPPAETNSMHNLAYVIYTSGSMGRPKGAMVTHLGMLNHLYAKIEALHLTQSEIMAQTASHCFDISVWQFFAVLLVGGQVQVIRDDDAHDPQRLLRQVVARGVTILEVVPSLLRLLLDERESTQTSAAEQLCLRWLIVTGEALSADLCRRWLQHYEQIPLVNAYGPTECSDDVTHALLEQLPVGSGASVPIGRAIGNTRLYILDAALSPVPVGVAGQVYVGGKGVGRGYLNEPGRTAEVFVPDPFGWQEGGLLYRTGDLGRYLANGQIEFLGRVDQQVKLRGYRVELGEIETLLNEHPMVRQSVVLAREEGQGDRRLVAYVVAEEEPGPPASELRADLQRKLPDYMLPSQFVLLAALPLTPNGKVDRGALPVSKPSGTGQGADVVTARTPIEEIVAGIWGEVLGLTQVNIHANFFEQGGHSLLAIQLISRLRAVMQVEVALRSLFEIPTVAGLAKRVEQALRNGQGVVAPPLLPVSRAQDLPLSFAQQRLWFLDQLEAGSTAYNIPMAVRLNGVLDIAALEYSVQELVRRHESLRTTFVAYAGRPVQAISAMWTMEMLVLDLQSIGEDGRLPEALRLAGEEAQGSFNLSSGPLLRVRLLRLGEQEHILLLTMHHIISDAWSLGVLTHELSALYEAFTQGKPSPLAPLSLQYADFAVWQREWLQGEVLQAHIDYWKKQLRGALPLNLPTDYPRPSVQSYRGASLPVQLSPALARGLHELSRSEGVTLFMTLLAAFQTLLYRYTGQEDVVVGTDIANRNRTEIEALIGFFVNLLVLRTDLSGTPTFRNVLRRVREMTLAAYTYQDIPFEMLVESLRLERRLNQTPLVQVLFVLQNVPSLQAELPGLMLSSFGSEITTAKFDVALFMQEGPQGLRGTVNYSRDLFEASTIATMMSRFEVLLHSLEAHPDTPIDALEIYTEAEKVQQAQEKKERSGVHRRKLKVAKGKEIDLAYE